MREIPVVGLINNIILIIIQFAEIQYYSVPL